MKLASQFKLKSFPPKWTHTKQVPESTSHPANFRRSSRYLIVPELACYNRRRQQLYPGINLCTHLLTSALQIRNPTNGPRQLTNNGPLRKFVTFASSAEEEKIALHGRSPLKHRSYRQRGLKQAFPCLSTRVVSMASACRYIPMGRASSDSNGRWAIPLVSESMGVFW